MLSRDERILLENVLDGFDRLFDNKSEAIDIYSLLVATGIALSATRFSPTFESTTHQLETIIRSTAALDQKRDAALVVTDELRHFIAEELEGDELANPKRRHHP